MAWTILCLSSIIMCASSEIIDKTIVKKKNEDSTYKLLVWYAIFGLLITIIIYGLELSESKLMPWEILIKTPAIIYGAICSFLYYIFYLLALKFIGVTIFESVDSSNSILIFIGMSLINTFLGYFNEIKVIFELKYLIPILMILIGNIILTISTKKNSSIKEKNNKKNTSYKFILIGIIFSLISVLFDAGDTLICSFALSEEQASSYDYLIGYSFIEIIIGVCIYIYLFLKNKKLYNPFKKTERNKCLSQFLGVLVSIIYIFANEISVLKTQVAWAAYPIVPMILARIFLKEKYSKKQYFCIGIVLLGSISFALVDIFN